MGVYIPYTSYDYTKMQGPAPDGFHVPSKNEWQAIYDILITKFGLAKNNTTIGTYLKMPMAGYRINNANVGSVGSYGSYWSSTHYSNEDGCSFDFHTNNVYPNGRNYRSYALSVRCFKNSPTVPTSSWATLYDGSSVATGAGIFYNATDGLISMSGDGTTWYTIQDKNLGATTVFNQGDTLTDANCGYFYQWGNNYGFAHSGTLTTSTTKVDASGYGPGNYYSSSTFITTTLTTGVYDWSSVQNDNLWGGVTGVNHMSELKNAYIGERNPFDDYQEVEYIQSTATNPGSDTSSGQYIDTNVTITKNIKLQLDAQIVSTAKQSRLFGGGYDSGSSGITFCAYINGNTQWARATSNGNGNWQTTSKSANTNRNTFILDNSRYQIFTSTGSSFYNATNSATISNSDTWTIPLFTYKYMNGGVTTIKNHASAKLYGCKIWDSGVLVRDFTPCYRKSDNEIGLWDKVNNEFYPNAGTGTFTKGPDVN